MKNLRRKCSLVMAIALLFTAVLGMINPMEAKAWTNLQTGQFDVPYTYSYKNGTVTYQVDLPSSGVIKQVLDVSAGELGITVYDASATEIYDIRYEREGTYTNNFWLIGGTYYIVIWKAFYSPEVSFKWTFESANESFNENQDNRNNDFSIPFPIQLGSEINGQFAANDYKDIYSFSTKKRGALTLNITDYHKSDLDISVVSEDGNYNYTEKDLPKGKKNITFQLPEGDYYIICSGDSVGKYSFKSTFTEAPAGVKLVSAKNVKGGKLKANWKKRKGVDGYEVQISKSSEFDNEVNSKLIKGASKNSFTFKGLNTYTYYGENVYFCRVRTYKMTNRIKAYSDWSEEKKVVIKR